VWQQGVLAAGRVTWVVGFWKKDVVLAVLPSQGTENGALVLWLAGVVISILKEYLFVQTVTMLC
jgi:hypothetical protein